VPLSADISRTDTVAVAVGAAHLCMSVQHRALVIKRLHTTVEEDAATKARLSGLSAKLEAAGAELLQLEHRLKLQRLEQTKAMGMLQVGLLAIGRRGLPCSSAACIYVPPDVGGGIVGLAGAASASAWTLARKEAMLHALCCACPVLQAAYDAAAALLADLRASAAARKAADEAAAAAERQQADADFQQQHAELAKQVSSRCWTERRALWGL
jgi:hypothetical protein